MSEQPRILLVDDDKNIRETLTAVLEENRYSVETTENGTEAIEKSKTDVFNVALIDIRLPDMDGTALLSAMRETVPKMAKIIITGYPGLNNAIEAVNKGADGYLVKPFKIENLLSMVKEQLEKQREARNYTRTLEKMRNEFVADVTDELLTPLASMKSYVDYVLEEKELLPLEVRKVLEVVRRGNDRLLSLTNSLLDIRRMKSGRLQLKLEPLDFREVIEPCIAEVQPVFNKRQSFRSEVPERPLLIWGDQARLSQVLINLLSNAAKFAPEGEITLLVKETEDTVQVQVSDTGIGIKQEDLPRVFEPFAAIQKPTYVKGTGLGLSITKGLVEAHEGKIWAESPGEGKGATFTFTLPKQEMRTASKLPES